MIVYPEHILKDEYKGKHTKKTHLTINTPRKWTDKEIEHAMNLRGMGFNYEYISKCLDRDITSVSIKLKRISKKKDCYNEKHREQKYDLNKKFIELIKPNSILDLYAGNSWYINKVNNLTTNDKDKKFKTDFNEDATKLIAKLYYENKKYDIIDLDAYGSAYDCFELSFRMAKKGIIITLGEFGHQRWKRTDFVAKKYNITNLQDFNFENINKKIIEKAIQNNCKIELLFLGEYKNIKRAYYKII
tara:strand:+ start:113 stop:847 length:735 start_codon:yes stop_codon:yes gene_type:complete